MPSYPESNSIATFKSDIESRNLSLILGSQDFVNLGGLICTNSANLYLVYSNALIVTDEPNGTTYSYNGHIDYNLTITQYLASLSGTPAPAVVRSKTVYLGDNVIINSQTNTVNLGTAKLIGVSDAVNAQDVPSYSQVQAVQTSLTESLSTTNTNVTNAVTTLTNSINSEKTRAEAAEAILTCNDITTINVKPFTDAMPIPAGVYAPFDGFYYNNPFDKKIFWNIPSPKTTFGQINYISFNVTLLSNTFLPYIAVYTKLKNDGTNAGSWFNARYTYEIFTPSDITVNDPTTNATPYQFYCALSGTNINNMPDYGLQKTLLPLGSHQTTGTMGPLDEILYITLQTTSGAAAGALNFTAHNFCVCTTSQTYEYNFSSASLTSASISSSLSSEVTRAGLAETGLQNQITSLNTNVNTAVSNISTIQTDLTNEVNRATSADTALIQRCSNLETTIINLHQFLFADDPVPTTFPIAYPSNRI